MFLQLAAQSYPLPPPMLQPCHGGFLGARELLLLYPDKPRVALCPLFHLSPFEVCHPEPYRVFQIWPHHEFVYGQYNLSLFLDPFHNMTFAIFIAAAYWVDVVIEPFTTIPISLPWFVTSRHHYHVWGWGECFFCFSVHYFSLLQNRLMWNRAKLAKK